MTEASGAKAGDATAGWLTGLGARRRSTLLEQLVELARAEQEPEQAGQVDVERELAAVRARLDEERAQLVRLERTLERIDRGRRGAAHAVRRQVELPRLHARVDTADALRDCQGFAVVDGEHGVGIVDCVRFHSRIDHPDELVVRAGGLRPRLTVVSVDDVEAVDGEEQVVYLRPRRAEADLAVRLLERARRLRSRALTQPET